MRVLAAQPGGSLCVVLGDERISILLGIGDVGLIRYRGIGCLSGVIHRGGRTTYASRKRWAHLIRLEVQGLR
ncbi:hypothetical protein D3C81_1639580 [compost metagenome]